MCAEMEEDNASALADDDMTIVALLCVARADWGGIHVHSPTSGTTMGTLRGIWLLACQAYAKLPTVAPLRAPIGASAQAGPSAHRRHAKSTSSIFGISLAAKSGGRVERDGTPQMRASERRTRPCVDKYHTVVRCV